MTAGQAESSPSSFDGESFRLKAFIDGLVGTDEVEVREDAVPLIDIAGHLDGNARAVLFRNAGPESATVVGNVLGSRSRIARAFGVPPDRLAQEVLARLAGEQPVIELARDAAPVQRVVSTGNDADLTRLPVHLQHALDGGPYISSGLDFVIDRKTGWTNV
ncbi:MAG: UbiD family decarboxylase, partial [Vicinamibacterales bacterium]|nr:UbiD family decarboxylase [Vicinamibacterales bacterium]